MTTTPNDDRLTMIHANIRKQLERFLADPTAHNADTARYAMGELISETRYAESLAQSEFVTRSQWTRIESGVGA